MSDSPLATLTLLSPHFARRTHAIDTITVHHAACAGAWLGLADVSIREGNIDGECLISLKSLPAGQPVVVSVVPRNSFDQAGRPIVSAPHKMPG